MMNFMTCHTISRGYIKLSWFDQHSPDHEVTVEITQTVFMRLIDLKRKGMQSEDTTTLD